jgi:hypothetical protein
MSGTAILGDARAFARRGWLPSALVDIALSVCDSRLMQFLFEAGCDAGLQYAQLSPRLIGVTLQHAAIQISDDLSDGDCTYLDDPARLGPLLVLALPNAVQAALNEAGISRTAQLAAAAELARVGNGQLRELRRAHWDGAAAQEVARLLNGHQLAAYLHLTWDGTRLADRAQAVGLAFGCAVHVATDLRSRDRRISDLSAVDRAKLIAWATEAAHAAAASDLASVVRRVPELLATLRADAAGS